MKADILILALLAYWSWLGITVAAILFGAGIMAFIMMRGD